MLPEWTPGTPRPRGTLLRITPAEAVDLVSAGQYAAWCLATRWTVLDLDVDGLAGEGLANKAVTWCEKHSLPHLLVESGTPGHYHLHIATCGRREADDLKAFVATLTTGRGGGLRRPGQYVRAVGSPSDKPGRPPSRLILPGLPTALAQFEPLAAQMAGDRERPPRASSRNREPLPLVQPNPRPGPARPLPPGMAFAMRQAAGEQVRWTHHGSRDRSETAAAILLSAVNAGWSWSQWWAEVKNPANLGLAKARAMGERACRLEFNRAVQLVIERPAERPREPGLDETLHAAWNGALTAAITGLWGDDPRIVATNLAAVAHAVRLADQAGTLTFGCADSGWQDGLGSTSKNTLDDVLARLSPCTCKTAACATACAHPDRIAWIEPQPRDRRFPEQPTVYRLLAPRVAASPRLVVGCGVNSPISEHGDSPTPLPPLTHDVFRAADLDRAGWLVLTLLHHTPHPLPAVDLCDLLGRGTQHSKVNRLKATLKGLAAHGLAHEGPHGWVATPVTEQDLDSAAVAAGTAGIRTARLIEASRRTAENSVRLRATQGRPAQAVQGSDGFWVAQDLTVDPVTGELVPMTSERPAARLGVVHSTPDADPMQEAPTGSDADQAWVRSQPGYYDTPAAGEWLPEIEPRPVRTAAAEFTQAWAEGLVEEHNGGGGYGHAEARQMPDGSWAVYMLSIDGAGDLVEEPVAGLVAGRRGSRSSRSTRRTA